MIDDFEFDPKKIKGLQDAGFTAPDVIGTVEGWRAWRVSSEVPKYGNVPKLVSASFPYFWAPRQRARAECKHCTSTDPTEPDAIPGTHCTCGFYSAKSLTHLLSMDYHRYDPASGYVCVVGQLANWGRVIEGTQGWRAEFAYPAVIYVPFEGWRIAKAIQNAYGVPVKLMNLLDPKSDPAKAKQVKE